MCRINRSIQTSIKLITRTPSHARTHALILTHAHTLNVRQQFGVDAFRSVRSHSSSVAARRQPSVKNDKDRANIIRTSKTRPHFRFGWEGRNTGCLACLWHEEECGARARPTPGPARRGAAAPRRSGAPRSAPRGPCRRPSARPAPRRPAAGRRVTPAAAPARQRRRRRRGVIRWSLTAPCRPE